MTCNDCIHNPACLEYGNILDPLGGGVICDSFQSKKDFVKVKQAHWKGAGMGDYYCSLCLETVSGNNFKYCPYCGAKMDE